MSNITTFRLSPALFNRSLITRVLMSWFGDLPITATVPAQSNTETWFGLNRTKEERQAFDDELRSSFGEALASISPANLHLPAFQSHADDRREAHVLSAPFRRLELLKSGSSDEPQRAQAGLGLVLLLDQIPRNIFRKVEDQAVVFSHYDRLSRALVHSMLLPQPGEGQDVEQGLADLQGLNVSPWLRYRPVRRQWFCLPMMHSEDSKDHDLFMADMQNMIADMESLGDQECLEYLRLQVGFEDAHRDILDKFGRYPHRNECLGREATEDERSFLQGGGETFTR